MATVSRVTRSRNQNPPPGSAPISEWFAYVTASHNEGNHELYYHVDKFGMYYLSTIYLPF